MRPHTTRVVLGRAAVAALVAERFPNSGARRQERAMLERWLLSNARRGDPADAHRLLDELVARAESGTSREQVVRAAQRLLRGATRAGGVS